MSAEKSGLDNKKFKFTNHSHRATAVSHLSKSGVDKMQLTKITGHGNVNSIKLYLHIDQTYHKEIITKMRGNELPVSNIMNTFISPQSILQSYTSEKSSTGSVIDFNNCTFNCHNFNTN